MTASSVSRKVAEVEKAKKVERRNAIEKRNQPVNDKPKHIEAEIGGLSAETSSSDSPVISQKAQEPKKATVAKKKAAKKS